MTSQPKSKLDEVLKKEAGGGGVASGEKTPEQDLRSALEKELDSQDLDMVKDLQRTKAEEIIERRRQAIEAMRARGGRMTPGVVETGGAKMPERGKDWLLDYTQGMLEKGLDPVVVGKLVDYLMGGSQFPMVGVPGVNNPPQGGITFQDMLSFAKMMKEDSTPKSDPQMAELLKRIMDKVDAVEKMAVARPAAPPEKKTFFVLKPDLTVEEVPMDRPIVMSPPPPPPASEGKPIEVVREENRHAEEMAKLTNDKEYKTSIADTLASIPEKIGKGLAARAAEQEGEEDTVETNAVARTAGQKPVEQQLFKCQNKGDAEHPPCLKEFLIPVGAASITCPFCGTIYNKIEEPPQESK